MDNLNNKNDLNQKLIDFLLKSNQINKADYDRAWNLHLTQHQPINTILTTLGLVSEGDMAAGLSEVFQSPVVDPSEYPDLPLLLEKLPHSFLKQSAVLPIAEDETTLTLAMSNPLDDFVLQVVRMKCEKDVIIRIALPTELDRQLNALYSETNLSDSSTTTPTEDLDADIDRLRDIASEAPVIKIVNQIISDAVEARASDIHFEPFETSLRIRYRIDGVLNSISSPPNTHRLAIISRIKILANLNIAERRLPQDGRIKIVVRGKEIDMRVSTLPTLYGEGVVLRILEHSKSLQNFHDLGFAAQELDEIQSLLTRPNGIILITGPTGSGKTTSLYAGLLSLNKPDVKIVTVEDPIEYQIEGINQIQTHADIGLDFASVLRSVLRHDPDIIMIGEIRDVETAMIAIQAALTGHLVLSTLHTNSAISAVTRLMDMGIDEYLIASTLEGVVAQRLVRKLCDTCKQLQDLPDLQKTGTRSTLSAKLKDQTIFKPVGCDECSGSGYRGRSVISEVLTISEDLQSDILKRASAKDIFANASKAGFKNLFESGTSKAVAGKTSLDEIFRVTQEN